MKLLRRLLCFLLLLSIIYIFGDFMATNMQVVSISFLTWDLGPYPIYLLVTGSFGAGIGLAFLLTALELLRSRLMIGQLQKKISKLMRENEKRE